MKKRFIGISGASGSGKTTLAKAISQQYDIRYVDLSSKQLWAKHHIPTHNHLIGMAATNPRKYLEFNMELLSHRIYLLDRAKNVSFVTDRTFLDQWCYTIIQAGAFMDMKQVESFNELYSVYMDYFNLILITEPFNFIQNDQARVTNIEYQHVFHSYLMTIIKRGSFTKKTTTVLMPNVSTDIRLNIYSNLVIHGEESVRSYIL